MGLSTPSYSELTLSIGIQPSYASLGPVFATNSKKVAFDAQGLNIVRQWRELIRPYAPLVVIDGIDTVSRMLGMWRSMELVVLISLVILLIMRWRIVVWRRLLIILSMFWWCSSFLLSGINARCSLRKLALKYFLVLAIVVFFKKIVMSIITIKIVCDFRNKLYKILLYSINQCKIVRYNIIKLIFYYTLS